MSLSDHLSRTTVADSLKRPTRKLAGPGQRFLNLDLLRMEFTSAVPVTRDAVGSYPAFSPLPNYPPKVDAHIAYISGGYFLLHWSWSRLRQTLSGILPCEARTFLSRQKAPAITCPTQISFYTLKYEPPTNSLHNELLGTSLGSIPTKY